MVNSTDGIKRLAHGPLLYSTAQRSTAKCRFKKAPPHRGRTISQHQYKFDGSLSASNGGTTPRESQRLAPRRLHHPRQRLPTQPRRDPRHILMMPRFKRRLQILRMQIANQRNTSMPQRNALIEQRNGRMRIALLAREFGKPQRLNTRRRHDVYQPACAMHHNRPGASPVRSRPAACLRESSACKAAA